MIETKTETKYKNNMDSAFSLLFIGIIGAVALILLDLGVFKLSMTSFSKIMINVVMGTVFTIFIITGIISYITSKKLKADIGKESDITKDITNYITDNITKAAIDKQISDLDTLTEEEKYMLRMEILTNIISEQFKNEIEDNDFLNEQLLDEILSSKYDTIFN